MTDESSHPTVDDTKSGRRGRPLPITVVVGMQVVDMTNEVSGTLVGFTEAFCIYKIESVDNLSIANWRDVAIGPVCPAEPLLPKDVAENDRRNASATVLRELLALKQFGFTSAQTAAYDELISYLRS